MYRESFGRSGTATRLMFPEKIEPLYCPPWRFFFSFGGKTSLGRFGVRPLLLTRIEDGSIPVPFPFPVKSLPSAQATAERNWPGAINPSTFDLATRILLSSFLLLLLTLSSSHT